MTRGSVGLRKLLLTNHVVLSVGWLGAVAAFLALSIAALATTDPRTVRALYIAMQPLAHWVLVPLSIASLVSGLVQSFVTPWGLFRHYWVICKLLINLTATGILLLYLRTVDHLSDLARSAPATSDLANPSPVLHSAAALIGLLVATFLSIYKPKGMTKYGQRRLRPAIS